MTTGYTIDKNLQTRYIVGGNSLTYSNNGINWDYSPSNMPLTAINTLEWNGTMYVAGGVGPTDSMAYSDNGTEWYTYGSPTIATVDCVKWSGYGTRGGSMFVATGTATNGNSMAYSLGGLHWTGLGNAMFGGNIATVHGQCVEWNGIYWMAGASNGATYKLARSFTGTTGWVGIDISNIANSIFTIMWNGCQWVIGGNTTAGAGMIAFSNNDKGTSWTVATCPITTRVTGLAYNGGRTVAVGNGAGNTIAYSDDFGATWTGLGTTLIPNTSPTSIHRVAWQLNKFVVTATDGSGIILYSYDGLNWKTTTNIGLSSCRAIISSSTMKNTLKFTANSILSGNYLSFDGGVTWEQMFADNINVASYNGKITVYGQGTNGNTYVSYDMMSAFKITTANTDPSGVKVIEWNGNHWLMGGVSHGATSRHLLLSYDGYNWKPVATNYMTSGYYVTGMAWCEPLTRWSVSVQTGPSTSQMIYSTDGLTWSLASTVVGGGPVKWIGAYFMAAVNDSSGLTKVAVSQDGVIWTTRLIGSYGQVESIMVEDTGLTIVIGTYPNSTLTEAILKSTNGVTWTPVGGINQNYHHYGATWDGLRYLFKTSDPSNNIRVSYDAINWTSIGGNLGGQELSSTKPFIGSLTIYQPTIACGKDNSGNNTMAFSKDGIFYKSMGNTLFSDAGNYVGWNGRMWIACGKGTTHTMGYSYDGLSWTGLGNAVFSIQANHVIWNGIRWIAVGEGGNTIATSIDGLTWTGLGATVLDASGLCTMWNGETWLVGGTGTTNTLAYSTDGLTWTGLGKTAMDLAVNDLQWAGIQWIMSGRSTTNNIMKYSTDITGWTASATQPFTTSANSVFWNGSITVAVGEGGNTIASSADLGITWTGQGSALFSTRGNEVAWNDKRWIATGTGTNKIIYSNDGAQWWPTIGSDTLFTEGFGIGSNPKVGVTPIRSAITLNNRDKVCVNTPRYYDSDLADDTSLVFNLNL
jgi:hypothetical protein